MVIDTNEVEGLDELPFTNELAERGFRMTNEKLQHAKTVESLEKMMIAYFNDPDARLN